MANTGRANRTSERAQETAQQRRDRESTAHSTPAASNNASERSQPETIENRSIASGGGSGVFMTAGSTHARQQHPPAPLSIDHEARPRRGMKGVPALRPFGSPAAIANIRSTAQHSTQNTLIQSDDDDDDGDSMSSDQNDEDLEDASIDSGSASRTADRSQRSSVQQSSDIRLQLLQDQESAATSMPYLRRRLEAAIQDNPAAG